MFVGHFAVAFAAKRVEPSVSLGTYFAAAQLPDLLWPYFLLTGVEHVTICPPPPSAQAIAVSMLPALAIAFWAAWADRHRAGKPI